MNYNMQGMTKTIPKLFAMLKSVKVEIKKEHQMLMVIKTTSCKKMARDRQGTSRRMANKFSLPWRSPKLDLSLKLSAYTAKGMVTRSGTAPNTRRIRTMEKWTKGIFDIQNNDVYLTSVRSSPWLFDNGSVARISNLKHELKNKQRLVKGEVTMCVGSDSKVDTITIAHSLSTFRISVEPK